MRERRVEDYLIRRVKETGGITRKVTWPGVRGAPDRFCGWPARPLRFGNYPDGSQIMPDAETDPVFALAEMKRPLTPDAEDHQKREHARLRACGVDVRVLATHEDVDRFIDEMTQ